MDATGPLGVIAARDEGVRYDGRTIALHWATAVLVLLLWTGGQTIDWLGHDASMWLRSVHVTLGVTLAVVLIARVAWRLTRGRGLPAADAGLLHVLAKTTHYALYALVVAAVGLGLTTEWFRGDTLYGLFKVTTPGERATWQFVLGYHALAANVLGGLALVHAAAALFHHYVLRDGVLRRMLPGR